MPSFRLPRQRNFPTWQRSGRRLRAQHLGIAHFSITAVRCGPMCYPSSPTGTSVPSTAKRIEEATGLQPGDLDENNVLHIRRVVYEGEVAVLEKEQLLPLDSVVHADLIRRIRALGDGQKWVFQSRSGTPINSGNVRRRFLHPAAAAVGVKIGGWHDFRHTLIRKMRKAGVHPVVVSGTVGHKRVELAPEVYDRANQSEIRAALGVVGKQLL